MFSLKTLSKKGFLLIVTFVCFSILTQQVILSEESVNKEISPPPNVSTDAGDYGNIKIQEQHNILNQLKDELKDLKTAYKDKRIDKNQYKAQKDEIMKKINYLELPEEQTAVNDLLLDDQDIGMDDEPTTTNSIIKIYEEEVLPDSLNE